MISEFCIGVYIFSNNCSMLMTKRNYQNYILILRIRLLCNLYNSKFMSILDFSYIKNSLCTSNYLNIILLKYICTYILSHFDNSRFRNHRFCHSLDFGQEVEEGSRGVNRSIKPLNKSHSCVFPWTHYHGRSILPNDPSSRFISVKIEECQAGSTAA